LKKKDIQELKSELRNVKRIIDKYEEILLCNISELQKESIIKNIKDKQEALLYIKCWLYKL